MNEQFQLTKADKTFYREKGYWIAPVLYDQEQVKRLRRSFSQVWNHEFDRVVNERFYEIDSEPDTLKLRRAFNAHLLINELYDAVVNSTLGLIASQIMNVNAVKVWYTQIIQKPSSKIYTEQNSANVGYHQDYRYWQCCKTSEMCTAWISLQDTNNSNGALRIIEGSHLWGLLEFHKGFNTKNLEEIAKNLQPHIKSPWREIVCDLVAGQVSFHHSLVLHGSGPNVSTDDRLGIAIHLMPANSSYRMDVQCHKSLTFLGEMPSPGLTFDKTHWPTIWKS